MTETTAATPNETRDAKLEIIMGREALDKLADATVLVLGCGGVGSNCCEALARGGIGHFAILDKENRYKNKMQEIIRRRLKALWDNTGFSLVDDPLRVGYYSEIDMLVWAKIFYGEEFVSYLKKTYSPLDVVFRLANETSLVLLNGGGFAGPEWSVRVSLANLNEKDYVKIGQGIKRILDEYAVKWQESRK